MKFKFILPPRLKNDLAEAMEVEKKSFETRLGKGMMASEQRLVELMAKHGLKTEINLSPHWDYTFVSDTEMDLEVTTFLDYIVAQLKAFSSMGSDVLKRFRIDKFKIMRWKRQSNESNNKILKALKEYEKAEPDLKITLMGD